MDDIPSRETLLAQWAQANRLAWVTVPLKAGLIAAQVAAIDWRRAADHPLLPVIAATIMVGPFTMGLLMLWAQKKKEVGDLKEQTRFGEFDKHALSSLFQDTVRRLQLPNDHLPLYITADKSLNAGAVRPGMASFLFKSLHGVYLNRQVLHKLSRAEIQDILGHELGHYYRYILIGDRFRVLTYVLGALLGILVVEKVGLSDYIGFLALAGVAGAFGWASGWGYRRHGRAIEYLCDDFGAHVHGVATSIQGLLKLGLDAEMHYTIHQQILLADRPGNNLDARELVEAIEAATPYGSVTKAELDMAIENELKTRRKASQGMSVAGFLKFAWQGGDDESQEEALEELRSHANKLASLPRLDWESILTDPRTVSLNREQLRRLVEMIEASPEELLFRLPDEIGLQGGIHPPLKSRVLYLWKNRDAIEGSLAQA